MTFEPPQPPARPLTFAYAFDTDLRRTGIEQSQVCEMLTEPDEPVITTAAISNWKKRNHAPLRRLHKLVEIFGSDSMTAQFMHARATEMYTAASADGLREQAPRVRELLERAQGEGVSIPEVMEDAMRIAAKVIEQDPDVAAALATFNRLMRKVPREKRLEAVRHATVVLAEYL